MNQPPARAVWPKMRKLLCLALILVGCASNSRPDQQIVRNSYYTCQNNLTNLRKELESYRKQQGHYPANLGQLRLPKIALCPLSTTPDYLDYQSDGRTFELKCRNRHYEETIVDIHF